VNESFSLFLCLGGSYWRGGGNPSPGRLFRTLFLRASLFFVLKGVFVFQALVVLPGDTGFFFDQWMGTSFISTEYWSTPKRGV